MIPLGILDATIYICILVPIFAALFALPAFYLSYQETKFMDLGRSKGKNRVKRRKESVHAEVRQVEELVKQLLRHIKQLEEEQALDSDVLAIRSELQAMLKEVRQMK